MELWNTSKVLEWVVAEVKDGLMTWSRSRGLRVDFYTLVTVQVVGWGDHLGVHLAQS